MQREHSMLRTILLPAVAVVVIGIACPGIATSQSAKGEAESFVGVCPPFFIRDENGAPINPVKGENAAVPYSPKQTCGTSGCHDYEKITKGYHFQQGKDELPKKELTKLYQWVLSPGQYGGRW